MKLELGCGQNGATREGYKTLDINPDYHPDFVGDARDLSRFEDNSIETILAIHILEHLAHWYGIKNILKEWYRVLKIGGYAEIYTPDLEYIIECYLTGEWKKETENPNYNFPHGADKDRDKWINFKLFSTANHFDTHTCCLTYHLLKEYALEVGFSKVVRDKGIKESLAVFLYK